MARKEEAYDAEIAPLMTKIIEVCNREKIALVANFRLDEDLQCTTALVSDEYQPTKDQIAAFQMLRFGFVAYTKTLK